MQPVIVTNVPRPPLELVDSFSTIGAATVHEAIGRRGAVGAAHRPIQRDVRVAGTAVTVESWPGDNLMIHASIEQCSKGDILVVTTRSPSEHGMFGELFATSLQRRGVRGLVIDAAVRDTQELREMGFPVWARHVNVEGTVKSTPGSVNVPVQVGGQVISPGDILVCDDDGVVVVQRDKAEESLKLSQARVAKEEESRQAFAAGELGLDRYGMREQLVGMGVTWVEYTDYYKES